MPRKASVSQQVANHTVWAEKFDGADDDIFAFQDRIATSIVGALEPKLFQIEATHAVAKPAENLDAYDCVLRALPCFCTFNDCDVPEPEEYLRCAITLDPSYPQAHAYQRRILTGVKTRRLSSRADTEPASA